MKLSTFKKIWLATYVVVLAILAIGFTSCNTVHKTTTSSNVKTDSVSIVKTEAVNVSKSDSTANKKETGSYEKETVYQYDTVYQVIKGDTVLKYVPRIIKVSESGTYNKDEMATHSNYDSSAAKEIDSAVKHSDVQTVTKKKDSKKFPFIIVGGLIAAFALVLIFLYFKRR